MKWQGYRRIAITSVKTDQADIRRRSKERHVADLAANIREHGDEPIHAPTMRMPGKALLCGRDRMAALLILKAKRLWVRLGECSDVEAADLEASENIHRRADSRADVLARAVMAKENLLTARDMVNDRSRQGGTVVPPSQRVKADARKAVAAQAGVTTGAVRKAEQRARARAEESSAEGPTCPPPGARAAVAEEPALTLNLLGCDDSSTRAVMKLARPLQDAIDDADKHLRLAVAALKPIELTDVGQRLRAQVQRVGELVRSERPESICPWCKGLPKATVGGVCGGCKGALFVSGERAIQAPSECYFIDPPLVLIDARQYPYEDVRAGRVKPGANVAAGKKGKGISVVGIDGKNIPLDD